MQVGHQRPFPHYTDWVQGELGKVAGKVVPGVGASRAREAVLGQFRAWRVPKGEAGGVRKLVLPVLAPLAQAHLQAQRGPMDAARAALTQAEKEVRGKLASGVAMGRKVRVAEGRKLDGLEKVARDKRAAYSKAVTLTAWLSPRVGKLPPIPTCSLPPSWVDREGNAPDTLHSFFVVGWQGQGLGGQGVGGQVGRHVDVVDLLGSPAAESMMTYLSEQQQGSIKYRTSPNDALQRNCGYVAAKGIARIMLHVMVHGSGVEGLWKDGKDGWAKRSACGVQECRQWYRDAANWFLGGGEGRRELASWARTARERFEAGVKLLDTSSLSYPPLSEVEQRVMVGRLLHQGGLTGVTPKGVWRSEGWPVRLTWASPGTAIGYLSGRRCPQEWMTGGPGGAGWAPGLEIVLMACPAAAVYSPRKKIMVMG